MTNPFMRFEKPEAEGGVFNISLSKDEVEILYTEGSLQVLNDRKQLFNITVEPVLEWDDQEELNEENYKQVKQ